MVTKFLSVSPVISSAAVLAAALILTIPSASSAQLFDGSLSDSPAPGSDFNAGESTETKPADPASDSGLPKSGTAEMPAEATPGEAAVPAEPLGETTVTVVCASCKEEVSVTAKNGQKCPHCGILWDEPIVIPEAPSPFMSDSAFADSGDPQQTELVSAQAGGDGHNQVAGVPGQIPLPAMGADVPQEMNLATLPLWMKTALFVGALAGCYYVMFYRR